MTTNDDGSEHVLDGIGATPFAGVGRAVRYDPTAAVSLPEPPTDGSVSSPEQQERFREARENTRKDLAAERDTIAERLGEDEAEIFDAHCQFLDDPQITAAVDAGIDDGLPAEHAANRAFDEAIEQFEAAGGLTAERTDDLREVRDRLLRHLMGSDSPTLADLPPGSIVVAERLGPADTVQLDPDRIAGFVTATGGRTSHVAVMARSLGLPAVVGVGDELTTITEGDIIVVDGDEGEVGVNPSETRQEAVQGGRRRADVRSAPVETSDGRPIEVAANIGSAQEAQTALDQGADGVGLFRTEFFFLDRDVPPSEEEQFEAFASVLETFDGERVVVRTLDIGGDKPIKYLDVAPETNPYLGTRGVRLAPGKRPDLFRTQLRALLRAAATDAGDGLAVMFPLVVSVAELESVLAHLEAVADELDDEGVPYRVPELGVMIETPASVFVAREIAELVDFLSLGTNDLTQYVMAAARDDDRVNHLYDPLQPPVLQAIDRTVRSGHEGETWVGMCGEMAGEPALTELLIGLDLDELSMSATMVPDVKAAVVEADSEHARELAERVLAADSREEIDAILDSDRSA